MINKITIAMTSLFILILLVAGCSSAAPESTEAEYVYVGSAVPNGAIQLEDFEFVDENGPVKLSDFSDKYLIIYFGYTFCPDFCPTTLSQMRKVTGNLGERSDDVRVIMISVDPDRDTPEKLGNYVHAFDPNFVGLTGTKEQIDAAAEPFGAYYEIGEVADDKDYYLVNHTTRTFLVSPDREALLTWKHETTADDITADLRYLMGIKETES